MPGSPTFLAFGSTPWLPEELVSPPHLAHFDYGGYAKHRFLPVQQGIKDLRSRFQ